MRKTVIACALAASAASIAVAQPSGDTAAQIRACVARKATASAGATQPFRHEGEITCPAGDIVGFPPRERRFDRQGAVTYEAPEGFVVVNKAVESIRIAQLSSVSGSHGPATVSEDGRKVSVPVSCKGRGVTEGRAWHRIAIAGEIARAPSRERTLELTMACAAELRRQ